MNSVLLIGRLGQDPVFRTAKTGMEFCKFSLATNEIHVTGNGEQRQRTEWHRIVAWGKTAVLCKNTLSKGKEVSLEGKLRSRSWQDKEGIKRFTTEIIISKVELCSSSGSGMESRGGNSGNHPYSSDNRNDYKSNRMGIRDGFKCEVGTVGGGSTGGIGYY